MPNLPNYDRYTRAKGWKKVMAVPGRVTQVPELNEMQSVAHDNVTQLGNVLFSDGSIIEGLQPVISGNTCTLTPGKLYAYGYVVDCPGGAVTITNGLIEKIGVKLTETVVTENEDADLTDPVTGAANLGMPGAYRLKYVPSVTIDDPTAFTLHVLRFGAVVTNNVPPQFDQLNQTLAMRTNEESGSYFVNGMGSRLEDTNLSYVNQFVGQDLTDLATSVGLTRGGSELDPALAARIVETSVTLTVEAGIAYVEGFRIFKPSDSKVIIPKARTTEFVNNEQQLLVASHTLGNPYVVTLNNGPIEAISDVIAPVRKTIGVVRSTVIGSDFVATPGPIIPPGPVSVTWSGYTYVQDVHFTWVSGNTITWSNPDSAVSNPGATNGSTIGHANLASVPRNQTYQVVVNYSATLAVGTTGTHLDCYVSGDNTITLSGSVGGVNVQYNTGGSAYFTTDYTWYLDRVDTIYISRNGAILRQPGASARFPVAPPVPLGTLAVSQIALQANTLAAFGTITDIQLKRLTMADLQSLKTRLERSEYNQAITNLNSQARSTVTDAAALKGIFTDQFLTLDRMDVADTTYLANPVSVNSITGELTPRERMSRFDLTLDAGSSTNLKAVGTFDKFFTAAFTTSLSPIAQPAASTPVKVNQYAAYTPIPFIDKMLPFISQDIIDNQPITVSSTATSLPIPAPPAGFTSFSLNSQTTTTSQSIVFDGTARFIKSQTVRLIASDFTTGATNIALTMDGIGISVVPDSPANGTTAGAVVGGKTTVNAAADGTVSCSFVIPADTILSGRRTVALSNGTDTAISVFIGNDVLRQPVSLQSTSERLTQESTRTIFQTPPEPRRDPVAQTFVFTRVMLDGASTIMVGGATIFFKAKPADVDVTKNIKIQLRDTIAGIPVTGSLTSRTFKPADIANLNFTADASQGFSFTFDDPILCEADKEYALVLMTDHPEWEIYTAKLGGITVTPGTPRRIDVQASPGVLLTSANGSTWTPDQISDLTYSLLKAVPQSTATAQFASLTFPFKVMNMQMLAGQQVPAGGQVAWEYSSTGFAGGSVDGQLDPTNTRTVTTTVPGATITVRARMTNTALASCQLQRDAITVIGTTNAATGVYVSQIVPLDVAPLVIKLSIDLALPAGTSVDIERGLVNPADANDVAWTAMTLSGTTGSTSAGFITYNYGSGAIATARTQVKFRITLHSAVSGSDVVAIPRARRLVAILS